MAARKNTDPLTESEIECLRALHRRGERGFGYRALATKFEIGISTVKSIIWGKRRAVPMRGGL